MLKKAKSLSFFINPLFLFQQLNNFSGSVGLLTYGTNNIIEVNPAIGIQVLNFNLAYTILKRCSLSNLKDAILFDVSIRSERLFGLPP